MKKVILVTGASSGIGRESAQYLLNDGHIVYSVARRTDKMANLHSAGARVLAMDMTDEQSISKGVQSIIQEQERIDVLFNNAGYGLYGAVEEVSMKDARHQFEVNLFGLASLTQLVIPYMREQKSGTIINTSSMGGKIYTPFGAWYHATKHALEGWSDCLRFELRPFGINVVIIEPGAIQTEFGDRVAESFAKSSNESPYLQMKTSMVNTMQNRHERGQFGSPPSVIAKVVSRIVHTKKPKTRYVAGSLAKPLLFVRKYFGDRVYDKVLTRMIK